MTRDAAVDSIPTMPPIEADEVASLDEFEGRKNVEAVLRKDVIHRKWIENYRNSDNETFYNEAFGRIFDLLGSPEGRHVLDAGCGSLSHAMRFARLGYRLTAVDLSESVLETARFNLKNNPNLRRHITLQRDDILNLPFRDETFSDVLCWGALMHIPDVERAISELSRVLKDGGYLLIGEGSMRSLQSLSQRLLLTVSPNEDVYARTTPAGVEMWHLTDAGKMLTRHANIRWLKQAFANEGLVVKRHWPGQFTELYAKVSSPRARSLVHKFNRFWFRHLNSPFVSHGNIIVLQKLLPPLNRDWVGANS